MVNSDEAMARAMRNHFEAMLPESLARSKDIMVQAVIPGHWFASAASECYQMHVAGYFYGSISAAQAYLEALSRFLLDHHRKRVPKDIKMRWGKLVEYTIISDLSAAAATKAFESRNDFHHLNKEIPQDYSQLQLISKECVNALFKIETEIFAYTFEGGRIKPEKPEYWPRVDGDKISCFLRSKI